MSSMFNNYIYMLYINYFNHIHINATHTCSFSPENPPPD